tara:strand:+ start:1657 stop:5307 length:3651 start_codon:yes stop_codon:yes gene_type:complete
LSVSDYYELTLQLLDKTQSTPTPINLGRISNGDLSPYRASITLTNTGNHKTDSGVLQLRIPQDGTFVRREPILVNESVKDRFVIQAQIRQADGSGGLRKGKIFRFTVGSPTIDDAVQSGETITLNLIPIQYRLKEHLQSKQLFFYTPRRSFEKRLTEYNDTKGSAEPSVVFDDTTPSLPARPDIDLPNDDTLKQNWLPRSPQDSHGLLWDVINRLSLPSTSGGTFIDYFFDMESKNTSGDISTGNIDEISVKAQPFGHQDSGIVLDPLSVLSPVDAEKDKTVISDLQKFKNNIILEGNQRSGSLPMERAKFNSAWQHSQVRPEWVSGTTYYNGDDAINGRSLVKVSETSPYSNKDVIRYFQYYGVDSNNLTDDPISAGQNDWYEDFTTIPEYSTNAQYEEFEIITLKNGAGTTYQHFQLVPVNIRQVIARDFDGSNNGRATVDTWVNHGLVERQHVELVGTNTFNVVKANMVGGIHVVSPTKFTYRMYDEGTGTEGFSQNPDSTNAWVLGCRTHTKSSSSPVNGTNGWYRIFEDIAVSSGIPEKGKKAPFYSYTPWTSNYHLQLSNLSGIPSIPSYSSSEGKYFGDITSVFGDEVQHGTPSQYYKCLITNGTAEPAGVQQPSGNATSTAYWVHRGVVPTWAGTVPDWNIERAMFDRIKSDDQFEQISLKSVNRTQLDSSQISTAERVNGVRFLINGTGVNEFANKDNTVAEWYQPIDAVGQWKFSKVPSLIVKEQVTDLSTGYIWGWNGTSWGSVWDPNHVRNARRSSPFHCVSNGNHLTIPTEEKMGFGLVTGSTQIPAQAIRLLYDWNSLTGSVLNMNSRGAWFCMHLPLPRLIAGGSPAGTAIGDVYKQSTLDATNLDVDSKGQSGWNNGLDSEDLGRINALTMKIRLSGYDQTDSQVNGYSNMPFKVWAMDIFGRIWFGNFELRHMNEYNHVRVVVGESAPSRMYYNRIDELFAINGFTFSQNFFLKQKEFTGLQFDWRFVKSWGLFWNVSYDDNGMYVGSRDGWINQLSSWATQIYKGTQHFVSQNLGDLKIPIERTVIDHVTLDIDELAFEKQLYANSDDTAVTNARTKLMSDSSEIDYENLKMNARAKKAREQFVNQQWHLKAHGDVRMKLGHSFKITGARVPENPDNYSAWVVSPTNYTIGSKVKRTVGGVTSVYQSIKQPNIAKIPESQPTYWINLNESVCANVSHVINSEGYTMNVLGVRKFVYSE